MSENISYLVSIKELHSKQEEFQMLPKKESFSWDSMSREAGSVGISSSRINTCLPTEIFRKLMIE